MNCFLLLLNKPRLLACVPKVAIPIASMGFWVAPPKSRSGRGTRKQYMRGCVWIIFLLRSEQNELLLKYVRGDLGENRHSWVKGTVPHSVSLLVALEQRLSCCVSYLPFYNVEPLLIVLFLARRDLCLQDHLHHLVYTIHVELLTWSPDSVLRWHFLLKDPNSGGQGCVGCLFNSPGATVTIVFPWFFVANPGKLRAGPRAWVTLGTSILQASLL